MRFILSSLVQDTGNIFVAIDIQGARNEPIKKGRALDAWQPTGNFNQLWTRVETPPGSGWYVIQSQLTDLDSGMPLVINIKRAASGPVNRGTPLDVFTPNGSPGQLWKFVEEVEEGKPPGYGLIQSQLTELNTGAPLFIDIHGASCAPIELFTAGNHHLPISWPLHVWTKDERSNDNCNQFWTLAPV